MLPADSRPSFSTSTTGDEMCLRTGRNRVRGRIFRTGGKVRFAMRDPVIGRLQAEDVKADACVVRWIKGGAIVREDSFPSFAEARLFAIEKIRIYRSIEVASIAEIVDRDGKLRLHVL